MHLARRAGSGDRRPLASYSTNTALGGSCVGSEPLELVAKSEDTWTDRKENLYCSISEFLSTMDFHSRMHCIRKQSTNM